MFQQYPLWSTHWARVNNQRFNVLGTDCFVLGTDYLGHNLEILLALDRLIPIKDKIPPDMAHNVLPTEDINVTFAFNAERRLYCEDRDDV